MTDKKSDQPTQIIPPQTETTETPISQEIQTELVSEESKDMVVGDDTIDPQRNVVGELEIQSHVNSLMQRILATHAPNLFPEAVEAEAAKEVTKRDDKTRSSQKSKKANKDPEPAKGTGDEQGNLTVGSSDWFAQFSDLPELGYAESMSKLEGIGIVRGAKVPFLNFTGLTLEHPLVFEHCELVGMSIRGVTCLQGIEFRNCWVKERILISDAQKMEPNLQSVIQGGVRWEGCCFDANVSVYRTQVEGDIHVRDCRGEFFAWDRCQLNGNLEMHDIIETKGLSCFRSKILGHLVLENVAILGKADATALDLKQTGIEKHLTMTGCEIVGKADFSRLSVGDGAGKAWVMEECRLAEVLLVQSKFAGDVRIQDCIFSGEMSANPPRGDDGKRAGRSCLFEGDLSVAGCEFQNKINFQHVRIIKQTYFSHCTLVQGGTFNQASFGQGVSFWESSAEKEVHFRKAHFQGLANFGHTTLAHRSSFNEAIFEDTATFFESQLEGDVFFSEAVIAKELKMGRLRCAGGLIMKKVQVGGQLNLLQANIRDRLILEESQIGSLYAPALVVGTWATLASCVVEGEVVLEGCKIGTNVQPSSEPTEFIPGSCYMNRATFHHHVKMTSADIRGEFSLEEVNAHREMELMGLRVGDNFSLSKGYFREVVRCDGTRVGGALRAALSRFRNEVSFNELQCTNASLGGSSFDQGLTIRSATIQDCLTLNNVDVDGKADLSKCSFQRIYFDHLLVDYLMIERSQIGESLASENHGNYAQAQNEYGILRQAFQSRNQYGDMDWAYYRFCQARRKNKKSNWSTGLEWLFLDLGFGYGTRPMNIAGVALGIILLFAGLFYLVPQGMVDRAGQTLSKLSLFDACHLSVLTFASLEHSPQQPHPAHWLGYFFTLEGLFGIFLITLFVATISRKIIRT